MALLFVDNLTVIDCSYLDRDRSVVGESWAVDIILSGELDEQGMVFDFGKVKKQIKQFIDVEVDHRLLVPKRAPGCYVEYRKDELSIEFALNSGALIRHQSPNDAVLLVDSEGIDSAHICDILQSEIKAQLPSNVSKVEIKLRTEDIQGAYYQYTHGLQKHQGQCQRIAHGHRSRIEIEINSERKQALEREWADRLKDSYIATQTHIMEEYQHNGIAHTRLAYTAEQGDFSISVPSQQLFKMPQVSTVENIAMYLAEQIAKKHSGHVRVKAFEGVAKGAYGLA